MQKIFKTYSEKILVIVPALLILVLWELMSVTVERGEFFFGSPSSVFAILYKRILDGSLLYHTWITLYEALIGFIIGNFAGTTIGLFLWYFPMLSRMSRPYIIIIGSIPIFAVSPIVIIWFGIGILSKIILAALSTIIVSVVQAYEGANQADKKLIEQLYSMGASKFTTFKKIIIPSTLAWLFAGYKMNVAFALLGAFIGEFIAAEAGLGYLIIQAMGLYNIPLVLAGVFGIVAISLILTFSIGLIQKKAFAWTLTSND